MLNNLPGERGAESQVAERNPASPGSPATVELRRVLLPRTDGRDGRVTGRRGDLAPRHLRAAQTPVIA